MAPAPPSEFTILTPNAMLGYGYRREHFWHGIHRHRPAAIIVDSGSTDGGPYKLGMNKMTCGRDSYVRDLMPMLEACWYTKTKVLISSAGGDGSDKHVQEMLGIVREVAGKIGASFKVATVNAGMDRAFLKKRLSDGKIGPCGPVEDLTEEAIDKAVDVVTQMGAEPFMEALKSDPDIIIGGRSYDPAPFAAFCMYRGFEPGIAWHMGKIMECGGICAVPKGRSMIATMRSDSFDLTPLNPIERCTPLSVAAHTLYEKTRPDRLPGPGGVLILDDAQYQQLPDDRTVRIKGAKFIPTPVYQIKLEGVQHLGYRTIFIGGIRDFILISQIDEFLEAVRQYTRNLFPQLDQSEQCRLLYHVYGKNGVMGPLEPNQEAADPFEIGVMGEVVAPTLELSHAIANNARTSILHMPYKGQLATTGNFASPLSPHEQSAGAVFKFSLYHLVDLLPGEELKLFPVTIQEITSDPIKGECPTLTADEEKVFSTTKPEPIVQKFVPDTAVKMLDIARVVRSKNSGPFEITFDIMFDNEKHYRRVKAANILGNKVIRKLYNVDDSDILVNMYFDPALAWKCTIKRPWPQGSVGERDTLGTQQHAPLLMLEVPAVTTNGEAQTNGSIPMSLSTKDPFYPIPDRSSFSPLDSVTYIWNGLSLPSSSLQSLRLSSSDKLGLPSSFKIGHIALSSIALTGLCASTIYALRTKSPIPPRVSVDLIHACVEFKSERLYVLDNKPTPSPWGPIGGLHATSDGHVRVHDSFPNHRLGAARLLTGREDSTRAGLSVGAKNWTAVDLEAEAFRQGIVISALRSFAQWDVLPQARAVPDFPVKIIKIGDSPPGPLPHMQADPASITSALQGLRVLELSRVIAAPLAGKTLAAHGADVLWITSPHLPDLPTMDRDFARGKRTAHLDLNTSADRAHLHRLVSTADVFIQGYAPGSLAARGFSPTALARERPGLIYGSMCAYGYEGPWAGRKGFDSLVQTCSGMNVAEAAAYASEGETPAAARPTPCQALDHAGGYFLALGIMAALYRRLTEGGSYEVQVSLAGAGKYLRSLGRWEGRSGFDTVDFESPDQEEVARVLESKMSGFGELRAVRHSVEIEGVGVGWEHMPKPLGSDRAEWA